LEGDDMHEQIEPPTQYAWVVYAVAMLLVGGLTGYVLSVQMNRPGTAPIAASSATQSPAAAPATVVDESELRAYRDILARDPKNLDAAVKAGNLLYDARRYVEAIGFYQQAFALDPTDINVSTDLGTALWYAGRADEALAQYQKSLAIDATHGQTLFNVGIVRADGKRDYAGAVAAWKTLLETNPRYPDSPRVQTLIADARTRAGVTP
jgi:tetratricopeptide (TPR) repeat protein